MQSHTADSSFQFPDLTAAPVQPAEWVSDSGKVDNGLGAFRGLAFALIFEAATVFAGVSVWHVWRLLR